MDVGNRPPYSMVRVRVRVRVRVWVWVCSLIAMDVGNRPLYFMVCVGTCVCVCVCVCARSSLWMSATASLIHGGTHTQSTHKHTIAYGRQ